MKKLPQTLMMIAVLAVVIEGFRLVTQSGLQGFDGTIQNDGYAVTGGIMILLGGAAVGYIVARARQQRKGSQRNG